jgi:hypothetical protein
MVIMKPLPTDNDPLPHRYRNLLPLTGLTPAQVHTIYPPGPPAAAHPPWAALGAAVDDKGAAAAHPPPHQPHHPALAALFDTSQSTIDRVLHHLVPVLSGALRPAPDNTTHPWIIDGTLIPVHDQSITAISKNYRRSVNTQIIVCAHRRRVLAAGQCWPGNRNDVIIARHTMAHPLTGQRVILGDSGYRGITSITTPRRDHTGRTIHDDHYRTHRRTRARVEHVIARLKDWQILRQCRRRGDAINHSLQIIAGLWNLKTRRQLRVIS